MIVSDKFARVEYKNLGSEKKITFDVESCLITFCVEIYVVKNSVESGAHFRGEIRGKLTHLSVVMEAGDFDTSLFKDLRCKVLENLESGELVRGVECEIGPDLLLEIEKLLGRNKSLLEEKMAKLQRQGFRPQ